MHCSRLGSPTPTSPLRPRPEAVHPEPTAPADGVELSLQAQDSLGWRSRAYASGPRRGDRGEEVRRLQQDLVRWMPGWQDLLAQDGVYGPQTSRALAFFKRVNGTGRDGRSMDAGTAALLEEVRSGDFWTRNPDGRPRHRRQPGWEARYQRALREGYPLSDGAAGLSPSEIRRVAARDPERRVRYRGFEARALTWKRFLALERAVVREFPGHHLAITCTTGGVHQGLAHGDGRGLDLVLERDRDGYRPDAPEFDSPRLEVLARRNGFETFNEYLHGSRFRTGPHLHAEAWPVS